MLKKNILNVNMKKFFKSNLLGTKKFFSYLIMFLILFINLFIPISIGVNYTSLYKKNIVSAESNKIVFFASRGGASQNKKIFINGYYITNTEIPLKTTSILYYLGVTSYSVSNDTVIANWAKNLKNLYIIELATDPIKSPSSRAPQAN